MTFTKMGLCDEYIRFKKLLFCFVSFSLLFLCQNRWISVGKWMFNTNLCYNTRRRWNEKLHINLQWNTPAILRHSNHGILENRWAHLTLMEWKRSTRLTSLMLGKFLQETIRQLPNRLHYGASSSVRFKSCSFTYFAHCFCCFFTGNSCA